MENLTNVQAAILAKAIANAWDDLPVSVEIEYGPDTEKKAEDAVHVAVQSAEVIDLGIKLEEDQVADLVGQFQVFLESEENIADLTHMEDELAELFSAE